MSDLREKLHSLIDEIVDAIENAEPTERPSTRARRDRKPRDLVRPSGEATPIAQALATRVLRQRGLR